jgi:TetR/AcrR family transcriptional regulator, regulator of cefoperazone and chloramphenicol sensitivity
MMVRKRSGNTKERLLAAASELFADKGFASTTVAEICEAAESNIAAVNYYFGGKESLYQQSWRYSLAQAIEAHPQDGGVVPDAPAETRLRGQIKAFVARVSDPNSRDFFITQHEMVNPTGLLKEVMESEMNPLRESTLALVRELLGPAASEQQVIFCEACIIGMCLHPMIIHKVRQRAGSGPLPLAIDDFEAFGDHLVQFALAGIAAVRNTAPVAERAAQ